MMKAFKSNLPAITRMKCRARIEISLKPGHSDPEGETTSRLLKELGYNVETVTVGKAYTILLHAKTAEDARIVAEEMCRRLLANPTKDNYTVSIEEQR
jgi:phosphoribosylformylglycinamidine synthase